MGCRAAIERATTTATKEVRLTEVHTVVIGGGHTGLAMSYCLSQLGVEHLVLERGEVGQRWRDERWDSLTLLTPNWMTQLPGFHYDGSDPDGFETRDGYLSYLEQYAASFQAPLQLRTNVDSLERRDSLDRYALRTNRGPIEARNVVIATGPFHQPHIPDLSKTLPPSVFEIHSSRYRKPDQLPDGPALVVGTGNSGLQIVEDLLNANRRVFVSVGRLRGAPRRYRDKDILWWLIQQGALDRRVEDLPSPDAKQVPPPLLTGVGGGHDLNLREFSDRGVVFLGRLLGGAGGRLAFSADINESFAKAEEAYQGFKTSIDQFVSAQGLTIPEEATAGAFVPTGIADPVTELDLAREAIRTLIWATGFNYTFGWVHLPVFDEAGEVLHRGGVTAFPGLYFLGLRWLRKYKSFFIYGVGEDAGILAKHIAQRA